MQPLPDQISLVVFPFENLSLRREADIFCRSFGTDLVTELSRFRQFCLISLPADVRPQNGTVAGLPGGIQPDYYVQGAFRCDNSNRIHINVQLYQATGGLLVWGNRVEGKLTEPDEIQENLLTGIVGALQQQINHDILSSRRKRSKVPFRAYEHWVHGMEEIKKGSLESDLKARAYFEKALEIQPEYSLACSGMSLSYFNEWSCQLWERWDACKSGAYEWAQRAIELDDQNYIAALVLGKILMYDEAWETSEYYLRKSLRLNQNDPETVIMIAAYFVHLGLTDEALGLYEKVMRLDPLNVDDYAGIGAFILFEAGDFQGAARLSAYLQSTPWADADAYCAGVFYYLNDEERMHDYWNRFLANYRRLITKGKDFDPQEAVGWLFKINPRKGASKLEGFLHHISQGQFGRPVPLQKAVGNGSSINYFVKESSTWKISYQNAVVQVAEAKGLHDIQKMLAQPNHFFHCTELMGSALAVRGERVFDVKARRDYERRINALQGSIKEAEDDHDPVRLEKLQEEYDQLLDHLSESLGLGGKVRETGGTVEKARSAVTWRIRKAIANIETRHPGLGKYLSNAIKTGTFCSYQPDRTLYWQLN